MSEWALAGTLPPVQLYVTLAMTMALFGVIAKEPVIGKAGYCIILLAFCAAVPVIVSSDATATMKETSGPESIYLVANAMVIIGLFCVMVWWWYKKVMEWKKPPAPQEL